MKKIVGIAPQSFVLSQNKHCTDDKYILGNNYSKRVLEAGGLPVCLAPSDNWLEQDALDMCDSFVVQGGAEFYPYHFQIIHHAVTRGKRYLGICLGQQLIYVYFEIRRRVEKIGYEGDLVTAICDYIAAQPSDFSVQKKIPNHRYEYPERGNEKAAKHEIDIVSGSLLHKVLGKDRVSLCSFHDLCTPPEQKLVTINAFSGGVVEGTEFGDHILGVQGHPELDCELNELFFFVV